MTPLICFAISATIGVWLGSFSKDAAILVIILYATAERIACAIEKRGGK